MSLANFSASAIGHFVLFGPPEEMNWEIALKIGAPILKLPPCAISFRRSCLLDSYGNFSQCIGHCRQWCTPLANVASGTGRFSIFSLPQGTRWKVTSETYAPKYRPTSYRISPPNFHPKGSYGDFSQYTGHCRQWYISLAVNRPIKHWLILSL